jgi:hypothetical protein
MCCNGWRASWSWASINGNLHRVASWRPITFADPRFRWESEPSRLPYHLPIGDGHYYTPLEMVDDHPRDWSTEQRLERLRLHVTSADRIRVLDDMAHDYDRLQRPWLGVRS